MIQPKSKKRVLIISSGKDATKVSLFVRNYIAKEGYMVDLRYFKQITYQVVGGEISIKIGGHDLTEYALVYFRMTKKEINRELAAIVSGYCKDHGIEFFDRVYLNLVLNNKLLETYYFARHRINQPDTIYLGSNSVQGRNLIVKKLGFPIIAKRSSSQRGQGLYMIKSEKGLDRFLQKKNLREFIFQKFIPNTFDWRIYVVGDRAILSERRTRDAADKKEFRNNVSLGAKKDIAESSEQINKMAVKCAKALGLTFAGIDIIETELGSFVLEGNRAPAFKAKGKDKLLLKGLPEYIISRLD